MWEISEDDIMQLLQVMKLVPPKDVGGIVHPDIIH